MKDNKDKLINDLNLVLKDNFDYVPLFKVMNVVDELIKKGWKFNITTIDKECLDCKRYYSGSCSGVEDRKREEITIENSCSGYLKRESSHINGDKIVVKNIIDPFLLGEVDEEEVKRIGSTLPKYSVGEIVDLNTWVGMKHDFKVVDVKVTYHNRFYEYVWGYKLYKDGESTSFTFDYISEGYLQKKR